MQIAILGDTHFGMRGDSPAFHEYYRRFYGEIFIPECKKRGIEHVIQVGDLFDRRKFINYHTLALASEYFFDELMMAGIHLWAIVGNHDIYYKNTLEINAHRLLLGHDRPEITIIDSPITESFNGCNIDLIPWICQDNEQEILDFIKRSKSQVCCGHFELSGFEMDVGNPCTWGMDRKVLDHYDVVATGHFHHRSTDGQIFYVGSPGEITWADYDESRGFHIFETSTRELEFIQNPFKMHHKVGYDDSMLTAGEVKAMDFSAVSNTYVKVLVETKNDPSLFDLFIDRLYEAKPLDITIVDDPQQDANTEVAIDASDTPTLIDQTVDVSPVTVPDKSRLKSLLRDVHKEAMSLS